MDIPTEFKQFADRDIYYSRDTLDDWVAFEDQQSNPFRIVGRGQDDKEAILDLYKVTITGLKI